MVKKVKKESQKQDVKDLLVLKVRLCVPCAFYL